MQHLYAELNKSEQVGTKLFSILTFISFAISLVGVNAIAIISTRKRRKEIAVRRVMGASEQGIVAFLTKEYVFMVIMASLIALPVSWIVMNYWLQGFAYRVSIAVQYHVSDGIPAQDVFFEAIIGWQEIRVGLFY